ncbi:MAG: hypothetical protein ACI85F_001541 [Bacteroidia bacterium]|jgi:hypothetical protein
MKASDELFRLIRTLTPSEKRYFKTNAKRENATSNYLQLFEAIDAQSEYDEDKLKKKHASKKFVKYLSAEKNYLHEQIMKNMRAFHVDRTVDNKINDLLQDEAFYRAKGLNELRKKTIDKAKALAKEYERFHLLKEVLKIQAGYVIEFEKKNLTEPVLRLINEQKQLAIIQDTELELQSKNRELFTMLRSGLDMKDVSNRNRADMLLSETELYRPRIKGWFTLQVQFERANSNYNHLIGDRFKSFVHTKQEYECFQQFDHFKAEDAIKYKICLANLMARSLSAGQFEWFEKGLVEMKSLPTPSFNEEGEVFQNVYFQEHLYYINSGRLEEAEQLVPTIIGGLEKYEEKINKARKIAFQFNIMVMYFIMHRFSDAKDWVNTLIEDNSEIKQHQKFITMLLLPIIHFELGHEGLVESYTRSAYRYLQKKNRLHEFERLMIKYLKDMPLSSDQEAFKGRLSIFQTDLEVLMENPDVADSLGMEEMNLWANSHLKGIPMHIQLKESTGQIR